tara:strand:+ start:173 stop:355 length:183 start_codon:yes stop_codon:yes gene_type:complete
MNPRSNTQISVSFGRNEEPLLKALDLMCKEQSIGRSAWIKQKIREAMTEAGKYHPDISFY